MYQCIHNSKVIACEATCTDTQQIRVLVSTACVHLTPTYHHCTPQVSGHTSSPPTSRVVGCPVCCLIIIWHSSCCTRHCCHLTSSTCTHTRLLHQSCQTVHTVRGCAQLVHSLASPQAAPQIGLLHCCSSCRAAWHMRWLHCS